MPTNSVIMSKEERIDGFAKLAQTLQQLDINRKEVLFSETANTNPWFTTTSIEQAINGLIHFLTPVILLNWLNTYNMPEEPKQVGIVMAGNIPLVGFHDFLCVIISGHKAVIKLSSQDKILFPAIIEMLIGINPEFREQILIVDTLPAVDAVIATGSNNSSRYFKKYFKNMPHIIRKNRTSVAVLNGQESVAELQLLGTDIFSFFGLGCRNVAKLFVPEGYDMIQLLDALEGHNEVINHPKYFNNYEYNKAIYLVNKTPHLDTGYALFTQTKDLFSPLAVIFYEEYADEKQLSTALQLNADKIQCIITNCAMDQETIPIGKAQLPEINDYADNIDTMSFLTNL